MNFHEEILETSDTLEGNSALKASYIYSIFKLPCFADDSGLEVDYLQNRPGVYSARYAGEPKNDDNNMNKLLDDLKGIQHRNAQFRTVITLMLESATHSFEGIITGEITEQKIGENGFGYDPIFRPIDEVKTFAQMTMKEKNARSHRALALEKMISFLSLGKFSN